MIHRKEADVQIDDYVLLALDPSSTATGYAVFGGDWLVEAGILRPASLRDEYLLRVDQIAGQLVSLIAANEPNTVVIEVPSGHVARRMRDRARGPGLSVYGMAVGVQYRVCAEAAGRCGSRIRAVYENTWTRGIPKLTRRRKLALAYPALREQFEADTGGDMADAIGIGLWCLDRHASERLLFGEGRRLVR